MAIFIPAPAGDGAVGFHPAVEVSTGADGGELPGRWRRWASIIIAPAGDGAVPFHPAGMFRPGADGDELPGRRRGLAIEIIAPADDGAVGLHPACVDSPGANRGELPGRRRGLAIFILAPAGDGAVGFHPASVVPVTSVDGGEGYRGISRTHSRLTLAPWFHRLRRGRSKHVLLGVLDQPVDRFACPIRCASGERREQDYCTGDCHAELHKLTPHM